MELKEFIKTAITDITEAVSELQSGLDNSAIVNPTLPNPISNTTVKDPENEHSNRRISQIDFDIAVTVLESTEIEGGAKAGISVFGAKIGTESSSKTENVSRLTFSIPIIFPSTHVKTPAELMEEKKPTRPVYDDV